jgi:hypothetical protein
MALFCHERVRHISIGVPAEVHFGRREFVDLVVPRVDRVLTVGLSSGGLA